MFLLTLRAKTFDMNVAVRCPLAHHPEPVRQRGLCAGAHPVHGEPLFPSVGLQHLHLSLAKPATGQRDYSAQPVLLKYAVWILVLVTLTSSPS